jgi:hypothetical protein
VLHAADAAKAECNITRLGRNVNDSMPVYCVSEALKLAGVEPAQCRVAVLGLAFRGGVSDTRLSPTYSVVEELKKAGVREISVHDPMVKSDSQLDGMLTQDLRLALKDANLVILSTDHKEYQKLSQRDTGEAAVYDGRGMLDKSKFTGRFASIGRRT